MVGPLMWQCTHDIREQLQILIDLCERIDCDPDSKQTMKKVIHRIDQLLDRCPQEGA